ncbi:NUDIX domain-containing protein [Pseudomonas sp. HR96]|uniref:NUDIX hydrolase n=1 Tax=Pseudomonas sp. HR96 TaxID=1027966 RepID=UPI002A74D06A|nr:NUDIX domain-containing protein [Pseudomonas sp. HR96]WPO99468.1 NUDIX domain-containing protein [Pseudomonas sp. HR96]
MNKLITIAAALLLDAQGRTLLVRKRGTAFFMQPGGKIDAGEQPVQALIRELREELGLQIAPEQAQYLGSRTAEAANEPGHEVHCALFRVTTTAQVQAAAEIEQALWVDNRTSAALQLAPLTRDWVLPAFFN